MKIYVGQQRRCTTALGRPFFRACSFPFLHHASVQPFLDEPHDAPICYPVLDELHQPFVRQRIEKARECPDPAPSSPSSSAVRCRAHPALDAGCVQAGIHTRIPESQFRRWRSTLRRLRAGRFCLPAPELRAVFSARRSCRYTSYAPASLDTLLASAYGRGPGGWTRVASP